MDSSTRLRRSARAIVVGSLVGLAAACDSPTAPEATRAYAYDPRYLLASGNPAVYHWPGGATIAVFVDARDAVPRRDLVEAVRYAEDRWREVSWFRDFSFAAVSRAADADVLVHYDTVDPLVDVDRTCENTAQRRARLLAFGGATDACVSTDGTRFLGLVSTATGRPTRARFDVTIAADTELYIPTQARLRSLVTHELGHVLGIGAHSNEASDIMFTAPRALRPSARDARTLRWVLRQPAELRP